jgi:hypothetical protein
MKQSPQLPYIKQSSSSHDLNTVSTHNCSVYSLLSNDLQNKKSCLSQLNLSGAGSPFMEIWICH